MTSRDYASDADFFLARQFIIDSYARFGWMYNWGQERWDIQRYTLRTPDELAHGRVWAEYIRFWEADGRIVGIAHPEEGGDLWLEVDPGFRHLEDEMIAWGERHRCPGRREDQPFSMYVLADDVFRQEVLEQRGWQRREVVAHLRRNPMTGGLPEGPTADGYTVRSIDLTTDEDSEVEHLSVGHRSATSALVR